MMPKDGRRDMLRVYAMSEARQAVKAQLKAANEKPSHYAQAEISRMAEQWLQAGHWQECHALALDKIMASPRLLAEWLATAKR
jgi:hypothetical protein